MGWQYEILKCPFCDKGEISCRFYPSAVSIRRNSSASLPGRGSVSKSKETWIIESGCSVCGKTRDDVEQELKRRGIV